MFMIFAANNLQVTTVSESNQKRNGKSRIWRAKVEAKTKSFISDQSVVNRQNGKKVKSFALSKADLKNALRFYLNQFGKFAYKYYKFTPWEIVNHALLNIYNTSKRHLLKER